MCGFKLSWSIILAAIATALPVVAGSNAGPCENVKIPCVPKTVYADPQNCAKYYKCSKTGERLRHLDCPTSQKFDVGLKHCTDDTKVVCASSCPIIDNEKRNVLYDGEVETASNVAASKISEDTESTDVTTSSDNGDGTPAAEVLDDNPKNDDVTESPDVDPPITKHKDLHEVTIILRSTTKSQKTTFKTSRAPVRITTVPPTTKLTPKRSTVPVTPKSTSAKSVTYVPASQHPAEGGATISVNISSPDGGSPTSGRRMESREDTTSVPVGLIIGVVASAFVVIVVIIAIIVVCRKKKKVPTAILR